MIKIILTIILVSIPIFSIMLQKHYAKKDKRLNSFNKTYAVKYLDWIFILFNITFLYAVKLQYWNIIIILISIIGSIIMHKIWSKNKKKDLCFFHNIKTRKLTKAGLIHLIFTAIEASLMIIFMLSYIKNIYNYFGLGILFLFNTACIFTSYYMHDKKIMKEDFIIIIVTYLVLIIRVLI